MTVNWYWKLSPVESKVGDELLNHRNYQNSESDIFCLGDAEYEKIPSFTLFLLFTNSKYFLPQHLRQQ